MKNTFLPYVNFKGLGKGTQERSKNEMWVLEERSRRKSEVEEEISKGFEKGIKRSYLS